MLWQFAKYEGLGNDFILIELPETGGELSAEQAVQLCDRNRGIGADGVLAVSLDPDADFAPRMQVINADGSRAEMCGNGLRCVALHLVRKGQVDPGVTYEIQTDAGPHAVTVSSDARTSDVEVSMRPASLVPAEVPVAADAAVLDQTFEVQGRSLKLSAVSVGNPHAVTFDALDDATRAALGPVLEKDARFPKAVNVGFAQVAGPGQLELTVWERGVGFTLGCGTGACAAAVVAVETGRAARGEPVEVRLPGGALSIRVGAAGERISMKGPARHVFDGVIEV